MENPELLTLVFLAVASLFAGFIDASVGGGGLIAVPAIFSAFPGGAAATLLGTNKVAASLGVMTATYNFIRVVKLNWRMLSVACSVCIISSYVGAWSVARVPTGAIKPVLLAVLIALAIYTFRKKTLGQSHAPRLTGSRELAAAVGVGGLIGFYDGFLGPGTGIFFVFAFVRWFGFDFLHASASAKVCNLTTNVASLLYFIPAGHVVWKVGLIMAVGNMVGSYAGSHLAIAKGSAWVRRVFLVALVLIIGRFSYDVLKPIINF